jgi:hypothetical protein
VTEGADGERPARPPLRFSLTIVDGRARLTGSPGPVPGVGRIDRLALEVPGLRFPFDLSQGARAFSDRRCRLVDFAFSLSPLEVERALGRASLARFGLSEPAVALANRGLRLGLRVKVAGREAELSAKVGFAETSEGWWRITLHDARVHGFVPLPAPLLLAALPVALGVGAMDETRGGERMPPHWSARPPALLRGRGLTEIDVDVAQLVLTSVLPAAGWRLPARTDLRSRPVDVGAERIAFSLTPEASAPPALTAADDLAARPAPASERGLAVLAEAALVAGEVRPATEGFRRALAAEPDNGFARERLFQLLASMPDGLTELEALADDALLSRPGFHLALVGKAVAAAEDGRAGEAAWLYARLAGEAETAGEILDETAALVAAAEQWDRAGDADAAQAAREKIAARRPGNAGPRRGLGAGDRGGP